MAEGRCLRIKKWTRLDVLDWIDQVLIQYEFKYDNMFYHAEQDICWVIDFDDGNVPLVCHGHTADAPVPRRGPG